MITVRQELGGPRPRQSTRGSLFTTIIVTLAAAVSVACGSGTPELNEDASCGHCDIVLDSVWTSSAGNPEVMDPIRVVEIGDSILMADHRARRLVLLGPSGQTLLILGGPGEGPGEFASIVGLARTPGSKALVVSGTDRISVFDSTLAFRSSFRPGTTVQGTGLVALDDSTLLLAEVDRSQLPETHQHLYSIDGRRIASFDTTLASAGGSPAALTPDGSVWVVPTPRRGSVPEFAMVEWDPDKREKLRELRRTPPWFLEWEPGSEERDEMSGSRSSVRPVLYDLAQPDREVIWTLTLVPDATGEARGGLNEIGDAILEAVDPISLEVLKAIRLDHVPTGFTPLGRLVIYSESQRGIPSLVLAMPVLVGR